MLCERVPRIPLRLFDHAPRTRGRSLRLAVPPHLEELLDLRAGQRRALPALQPRSAADGAAAAPAGLKLVAPPEEGLDVVRDEVADLADGVPDRALDAGDQHHADHAPGPVDLLEPLHGAEVPEIAVGGEAEGRRGAVVAGRRLLPGLVPVVEDLQEPVQGVLGLRLAVAGGEGEVERVGLVAGDRRAVGVHEPDAVDEVLHLLLAHPLGVEDQPQGDHRVGVEIVDDDLQPPAIPSELDRLRHLLAGGEREGPDAPRVVVEAVAAALVVDRGPLHGAVEIDGVVGHLLAGGGLAVLEPDDRRKDGDAHIDLHELVRVATRPRRYAKDF